MRTSARLLSVAAIAAISLLAIFVSCRQQSSAPDAANAAANARKAKSDLSPDAESYADSIIKGMSVEEKIGQLFMPALYSSDDEYTLKTIRRYAERLHIGGVILLKGTSAEAHAIADEFNSFSGIPPFISIDAEWGLGMRLSDAPSFPANSELSRYADESAMYDYGNEIAQECRRLGINMVLGPVLDVAPEGSFMGRRSYGGDPRHVADLGVAYAHGLESGRVISVAKHFPGHGSVNADSHARLGSILRSLNEMENNDLYPFRRYIEQRLSAIMVGHLNVPAVDYTDRPAAVSHAVISELLRDDMGFDGVVLTDALNMGAVKGYGSVDALKAGADIVLAPRDTEKEIAAVFKAITDGRISELELNEKIRRILKLKYIFIVCVEGEKKE